LVFATIASQYLIVSTDCGDSWKFLGGELPANSPGYVYSFAFSDSFAFAAGGGGVWRRPMSEITTSLQMSSNQVPHALNLSQNYPNPFNPSTTIRYGLPNRSYVTLTVFNTLGQSVSTLVNGEQDAGYHEVQFDGKDLSSGIYFYRLQAGEFVSTKRMLIMK
jgi:hypothetical protein